MAETPPLEIGQAIENAVNQVRIELMRLYADGDIGTVTVHCGKAQMRVKATPERIREPVRVKEQTK